MAGPNHWLADPCPRGATCTTNIELKASSRQGMAAKTQRSINLCGDVLACAGPLAVAEVVVLPFLPASSDEGHGRAAHHIPYHTIPAPTVASRRTAHQPEHARPQYLPCTRQQHDDGQQRQRPLAHISTNSMPAIARSQVRLMVQAGRQPHRVPGVTQPSTPNGKARGQRQPQKQPSRRSGRGGRGGCSSGDTGWVLMSASSLQRGMPVETPCRPIGSSGRIPRESSDGMEP
ncbi:hypothetical protein BP5796_04807 [Coleophoma crateriformis]|uniref:Uncharacterized protein n=1 Tax=Coleophoma crateriformis TaxID=565419 RepID=A0A3D8SAI8_9HELO|nr:hypothetical protein BP5796_04807 [Coleophoma crateriformis]